MGLGSFVSSAVGGVVGMANRASGGAIGKLLGAGIGKGSSGGAGKPKRERYKRKKRMRYVSKRRKAFNAANDSKERAKGYRDRLRRSQKVMSTQKTPKRSRGKMGAIAGMLGTGVRRGGKLNTVASRLKQKRKGLTNRDKLNKVASIAAKSIGRF